MSKIRAPRPVNARSSERFTKRRPAKHRPKQGRNQFETMVSCAKERIVCAMVRKTRLYVENFKEAVHTLLSWVDNRDQRLGWGEQVIKVLSTALHELMQSGKILRMERKRHVWYQLTA